MLPARGYRQQSQLWKVKLSVLSTSVCGNMRSLTHHTLRCEGMFICIAAMHLIECKYRVAY